MIIPTNLCQTRDKLTELGHLVQKDDCSHVVEYKHATDRDAAMRYTKLKRTKCCLSSSAQIQICTTFAV